MKSDVPLQANIDGVYRANCNLWRENPQNPYYLLAKLLEFFDPAILEALKIVSGHSLKHLAAALGLYVLWRGYRCREKL